MAENYAKKIAKAGKSSGASAYAKKIAAANGGGSGTADWSALGDSSAAAPKKKAQTPVGWIVSMLDRPANIIRTGLGDTVNDLADMDTARTKAKPSAHPLLTALTKGINYNGDVSAAAKGDVENSTSKEIERVADTVGKKTARENGTTYNDTENNVNPWVKGIGGFVGDVALDPTTYIPGADVFSVSSKVIKGVRGGVTAAKGIEEGASAASKIATVAKAGAKAAVAKKTPKAAQTVADEILAESAKTGDATAKQIAVNAAPDIEKAVPTEVPVAPVEKPINPSDFKPEPAATPEPSAPTKQDWEVQQIDSIPDTVKVGTKVLKKSDIAKAHAGNADALLPDEAKAANKWLRDNLNDKSYQAYVKTFGKAATKATPEQQAAVAAIAAPGVDQKVADYATAEAVKNIGKGVKAAPDAQFAVNHIDQSKVWSGSGSASARSQHGILSLLERASGGVKPNGQAAVFSRAQNGIRHMKAVFDNLEAKGTPVTVDGTPLRADEVLQHIADHSPQAAAWFANGTGRPDLDKVLLAARDAAFADPSIDDAALTKALLPKVQAALKRSPGGGTMAKLGSNARPGYAVTSQQIAKQVTDALVAKRSDIAGDIAAKTQYWADRNGAAGLNVANGLIQNLQGLSEKANPGDYLKALHSLPGDAKDFADEMGARQVAKQAQEAATRAVPNVDVQQAQHINTAVSEMQKAIQKPSVSIDAATMAGQKATIRNLDTAVDDSEEDLAQVAAQMGQDVSEAFGPESARKFITNQGSMLYGLLSKFKADLTAGKYFGLYQGTESLTHNWLGAVTNDLKQFSKGFDADTRQRALKALQSEADPADLDPATAQAVESIRDTVSKLFNVDDPSSLVNDSFLRQGANLEEVNKYIRNPAYRIDLDAAAERASINGTDLFSEAANDWRSKDIEDPIDYLLHMHQGMIQQSAMHSAAQTFMKHAADTGLSSATKKAGYVRVNPERGSFIGPYLDRNKFYDKDAIRAFRDVDRLAADYRDVNRVPQIIHTFDSVQNMWKLGMTSLRPGFHIRNAIGDTALTMLDVPAIKPKLFTDAVKVLNSHNSYDGFDAINVLRNAGESELTGKGDKIMSAALKGGKKQDLTNEDMYRLAKDEGLLGTFNQLEGLIDTQGSAIDRVVKNIGNTGVGKIGKGAVRGANAVATFETHHARMVHFMAIMQRDAKKFDNVTSLAEYAAKRVKKFHPDPSMLSPFEKKVLRRVIPFYSWQRAILPLVAESLLTRPGRTMLYPKASYNLAVSLGVDPYSMSQPFPQNDTLPSFVTNQAVGPVANVNGKNYSITPGIATTDTLADYVGSNPIRTTAGSLTPAIKAPIELLTGKNLQTGGNIDSASQYILGQIPGANYVSRAATNASGDDPEANKLMLTNWLTGLGIQDVDKPSYKKYAQYEQSQNGGN